MAKSLIHKGFVAGVLNLAALGMISCGKDQGQSPSQVKVTNGEESREEEFPSVVLLVMMTPQGQGICTGTFVNDSQLVTAGHCVEGLAEEAPQLYYVKVIKGQAGIEYTAPTRALNYHRNPNYSIDRDQGVNGSDLAVVNFPEYTAPATIAIAEESPAIGSELTIVGYGNNRNYLAANGQFAGSGSGVKRAGTNKIQLKDNGFLSFAGVPESIKGIEAGQYVSSGSGDSGGPMFVDGELVGVTSGGGLTRTKEGMVISISHYVDLNSDESQAFLNEHLKP